MVREPLEGPLRNMVGLGAAVVGGAALAALGVALLGECLRRRRRAPRTTALIRRIVPAPLGFAATALLATLPLLAPRPATANDSVRDWLHGTSGSVTMRATSAPPASPGAGPSPPAPSPPAPVPPAPGPATVPIELPPPLIVIAPAFVPPTTPPTHARTVAPPAPAERYVVKRGDCLWSIAAARLGAGAPASAIDTAWRRIYAANRAAIGADPNLILVGAELSVPPLDVSR
ncbi:MAG: LysM peptidoglycan-binding domain-containing protein [Actinobacteria bacterium]|nr:LysM peptidoglycan-binding domain-containing protein [Actinomycetota bacterium]